MDISIELRQSIVEFLTDIPNIGDSHGRQALLQSAGLDKALLNQLSVDRPPTQFMELLVSTCLRYGELQDGRHALESVLEATKKHVGKNKRECCDILLQRLRGKQEQPKNSSLSPEEPNISQDNDINSSYFAYISASKIEQLYAQIVNKPNAATLSDSQIREMQSIIGLGDWENLSFGPSDYLLLYRRQREALVLKLKAVIEDLYINNRVTPLTSDSLIRANEIFAFSFTGKLKVKSYDLDAYTDLRAKIDGIKVELTATTRYFSELFTADDKDKAQLHSANVAFFNGRVSPIFRCVIIPTGVSKKKVIGSPLYLALESAGNIIV